MGAPYFTTISAEWVIPNSRTSGSKSASWIGIDDDGASSLAQAGWVDQNGGKFPFVQWASAIGSCTGAYCSPVPVTGFTLQTGDVLALTIVLASNPATSATATFVNKWNGNASTQVTFNSGSLPPMYGVRCAWLMEANPAGINNFGACQFFGCQGIDTNGVAHQVTSLFQMVQSGVTLVVPAAYANVATGAIGSVLVYQP